MEKIDEVPKSIIEAEAFEIYQAELRLKVSLDDGTDVSLPLSILELFKNPALESVISMK